jgi:hypothetical protein
MDQSNYPTPLKAQARRREEGQIDCKDRLSFNECIRTQYKGILAMSSSKLQSFEIAEIHN